MYLIKTYMSDLFSHLGYWLIALFKNKFIQTLPTKLGNRNIFKIISLYRTVIITHIKWNKVGHMNPLLTTHNFNLTETKLLGEL